MRANRKNAVAKSGKKNAFLSPFESALYPRFCWLHYAAHPRLDYAAP
jgi:hypothetical protein